MTVVRATSIPEATRAMTELPGAVLVGGGTELVVDLHEGHRAAAHLVLLKRVPRLRGVVSQAPAGPLLGAMTTYRDLASGVGGLPVLAAMAPTVGSPASRNAGTLGGALGTASGSGDAVTALLAAEALLVVHGAEGVREVPVAAWLDGSDRQPADLVAAVAVPRPRGPQAYLKAGERQAVCYATASVALVVDEPTRTVRCAVGSVGPHALRATAAEALAAAELDWDRLRADPDLCSRFGAAVAAGLPDPPDGLRVSGAHRRHVAGVLAGRALRRVTSWQAAA